MLSSVHCKSRLPPLLATLFDIGLHLANNGRYLQDHELGPFLYMPKLHDGVEAQMLESILAYCEKELRLAPAGTKVTTRQFAAAPPTWPRSFTHTVRECLVVIQGLLLWWWIAPLFGVLVDRKIEKTKFQTSIPLPFLPAPPCRCPQR